MHNDHENNKIKIYCESVEKIFIQKGEQRVPVLKNLSFSVKENEFVVLVGPGQCGKSTLLKIIAGLEIPTSGKIYLNKKEIKGPGPDRCLVFQSYMLFPWKTVTGNIQLGPKLRGINRKKRKEIAQHFIELVGLQGFENKYPHQLSGGMKQRVGIARAYANNPEIMLLDEPFGQLDAQTRIYMEKETERIWQREKRTVIFVTNNIDEAIYLGDRIITIEDKLPGKMGSIYNVNLKRPREHTDYDFLELREKITSASQLVL